MDSLLSQIEELKNRLFEANSIIEAIREGEVDALVLNKEGQPHVYSITSADYTYRILIEKIGEGALSISEEGLILYCNDHFSKLIGISANEITGTYIYAYFNPAEEFIRLKDALVNGTSKGELILNGREKELQVYVSLTDLNPHIPAIGLVVTDLTEKNKNEADLRTSQRKLEQKVEELNTTNTNLEQFIHVISHDLKEPLRKVITYTSHLYDTKSPVLGKSEMKSLDVINSSALRLNSLVDDLVKYAFSATKTETGNVDLKEVLKEVMDDLELVIRENGATIECMELPAISGSKVQMRQLFSNIISNAIKYSRKGVPPRICITTAKVTDVDAMSPEKQFFKVSFSDNGIGMEKSHLSKIFTIFQRLHLRDEYSGNGIGLAICKKIMENHRGKIEVESSPDNGSIFYLYFPIEEYV